MSPRPGPILAADLGGTKITAGLVTDSGEVLARRTVPTPARQGAAAVIAALLTALQAVRDEAAGTGAPAPTAAGIGSAGVVDPVAGRIVSATDAIPGWAGTALGEPVSAALGLPTAVLNDVHAHGLGEAVHGAGAGAASLLLVAVGTGIGGALVVHGEPMAGAHGVAGHVGHLPVPEAVGVVCSCGRTGHLEGLASGPGLLAAHRAAGGTAADTREIVARADAGDEPARQLLHTGARATGRVIGGLLNVLDPALVVVSGGMAGAGPLWWDALHEGVAHDRMDIVGATPVLPAAAGADAALLGAAEFARRRAVPVTHRRPAEGSR